MTGIRNKKKILFGSGGVGILAYDYFGADSIECFIDNNQRKVGQSLLGKPIKSFEALLNEYANKDEYRIYITTDTFFAEIAEQLNESGVTNYTFFRDYIPDYPEIVRLIRDEIDQNDKVAICGINNITESIIDALSEENLSDNIVTLYDYDTSGVIGKSFYEKKIQKISQILKSDNDLISKIILTIPKKMIFDPADDFDLYCKNNNIVVVDAREAVKYQSEEYLREKKFYEEIDPSRLLSSKRIDIIPKYLLMKMLLRGENDEEIKSLYVRTLLMWENATEKLGLFSFKAKQCTDDFLSEAKTLLLSMKEKGFCKYEYIPTDDGVPINGQHRTAAALALNEKVWIHAIHDTAMPCDFAWFEKNGFTESDKLALLDGFSDIYRNCGLLCVYAPAIDYWDYIRTELSKHMSIIGTVDLDFSENFYSFENIINDIYLSYNVTRGIDKKIKDLFLFPLKMRIVLVTDEGFEDDNLYAWITQIKNDIRDRLIFDVPFMSYATVHAADGPEEFKRLKAIVLSKNNIRQLKRRVNNTYRRGFLDALDELKNYLKKKEIALDEVCIVGSAVLEVFGIRESEDLDLMISNHARTKLGLTGLCKLSEKIEIVPESYMRNRDGVLLNTDHVIFDNSKHFMFYGMKFCNLELIREQKEFSYKTDEGRTKDKKDCRLIDVYEDFASNFASSRELREQLRLRYGSKS